jgi:nitroreductase
MEFNELIQVRRSVRAYKEETVSHADIEAILRAMQQAPTWKNSQTGRYYVIETPEKVAEIKENALPAFNQKSSKNAPVLIVTTFVKKVSGHTNEAPDNELGDEWGAYDLGLQNAYLALKAADLGLDTLIMGIRDEKEIRSRLDIPEEEEVVAVIALGYREGEPAFRPRKELEEIVKYY